MGKNGFLSSLLRYRYLLSDLKEPMKLISEVKEPLSKPVKIDHARCWVVMSGIYPLKRANRRQKWC